MFRLLDKDWTSVYPHRSDYHVYRGSNNEIELFNGGVSIVFPIPESSLEKPMENVDLQIHASRKLSRYFELHSSENIGVACIDVSDLFNRVIDGIKERRDLIARKCPTIHPREPVSMSSKDTYSLIKEDGNESGANATLYLRLTHLGQSVISEIHVPEDPKVLFYAREETTEKLPYQCREITIDELTGGCWGSQTLLPPRDPRDTICCCDSKTKSGVAKSGVSNDSKPQMTTTEAPTESVEPEGSKTLLDSIPEVEDMKDKEDKKVFKKMARKGKPRSKGGLDSGDDKSGDDVVKAPKAEENLKEEDDGVSCSVQPNLCGREGTCNKKSKKGKFGKCGKPDGEGGNPLACGERRKCALRKSAAGTATVGIVDKKVACPCPCPCPPPPPPPAICSCPTTSGWTPSCNRCQPRVYYPSMNYPTTAPRNANLCQSYDTAGSYNSYETSSWQQTLQSGSWRYSR